MASNRPTIDAASLELRNYKDTIGNALASSYWDNLLAHLASQAGIGVDDFQLRIIARLGLTRHTGLRWFDRSTFVNPGKFFVVLAAYGVSIHKLPTPQRNEVICTAVCRLVERLRASHFGGVRGCKITREKLICADLLLAHPDRWVLWQNKQNENSNIFNITAQRLNLLSVKPLPESTEWDEKTVSLVCEEWFKPYFVFAHNRPPEWDFLHEF